MKIVTSSNNKKKIRMSKKEWQSIGKTAGWMDKTAQTNPLLTMESCLRSLQEAINWASQPPDPSDPYKNDYRLSPQEKQEIQQSLTGLSQQIASLPVNVQQPVHQPVQQPQQQQQAAPQQI